MTTIDTSTEAVERLALDHQAVGNNPDTLTMSHPHHWRTAAVLRQLVKERDDLRAKMVVAAEALKHYRETLCEGFCEGDVWADEGHSHPDIQRDCGGCLAASVLINCAALAQIKGNE